MNDTVNNRCLSFCLGEEEFAIPLLTVREVIAKPDVTPVPHSPPYFLGVINLRGLVISLVDLRTRMNIKPKVNSEESVIICDFGDSSVGVVVDSINSVMTIDPTMLSPKPDVGSSNQAQHYISGIYRREKNLVLMLEIGKALNIDDLKKSANTEKQAS